MTIWGFLQLGVLSKLLVINRTMESLTNGLQE